MDRNGGRTTRVSTQLLTYDYGRAVGRLVVYYIDMTESLLTDG